MGMILLIHNHLKGEIIMEIMQKPEQTEVMSPKEKVQSARKSLGMNQSDFAKALGVSQGLISLIESGRAPVSSKLTAKLTQLEKEQVEKVMTAASE